MKLFNKREPKDYIIYSAIIFVGIFLDQLTKWLAYKFLMPIGDVPLINGVLHLTWNTNAGAAWGMLDDQRWIFITVSTLAILVFGAYLYLGHAENYLYAVSIAMVVSGGIGNMIDRVGLGFYVNEDGMGEVIDFIYFKLIDFPVFNGADSIVCVGAGILILALVLDLIKEYKAEAAKKSAEKVQDGKNSEDGKEE